MPVRSSLRMNNELEKLIDSGESATVEFKKSFGKTAIEAIAAFANSDGGFLCIGIEDNGVIRGVTATEDDIKDWINQLKMATTPSLFPQHNICTIAGRRIVLFTVQEYPLKPVACRGRYFKRSGASNHQMTSDEIVELKLQSTNASFDSFTVACGIDKLDKGALEKFSKDISQSGRFKPSDNIANDLEKLGFLQNGQLTRAIELLFGNHHTGIHIGRFKSKHTIIDDLMIRAPLMQAVDEAMEFMQKNIRLGYGFTGELKREETWQYPLPVLRELLLNAVIHKDYRDPTDVIIKIFDDSIEFTNPGELFGPLNLESLKTDFYRASHRNKLLAEAFYLTGQVEKYGTGYIRMRRTLKADYPKLQFLCEEIDGCFRVTLSEPSPAPTHLNGEEKDLTQESSQESSQERLQGSAQKIMTIMKSNPQITIVELAVICKLTTRAIQKNIDKLRQMGVICREGSTKSGYWKVLEK